MPLGHPELFHSNVLHRQSTALLRKTVVDRVASVGPFRATRPVQLAAIVTEAIEILETIGAPTV